MHKKIALLLALLFSPLVALAQTVTWNSAPSSAAVGANYTLTATASAANKWVTITIFNGTDVLATHTAYSNASTSITLSSSSAGTITYTAEAERASPFGIATSNHTITITKANQTISFGNPGTQTFGGSVGLSASASSGLGVGFSVVSGPAYMSGNTVIFTGAGGVTVRASQGGNATYNPAPNVDQSFTVNPRSTSFSLSNTAFTYNGSAQGPSVNSNPGGASFSTAGTLSATNVGSYTASASAYGNYTGSNGSLGWTINRANQAGLSLSAATSQQFGTTQTLSASGGSGAGGVSYVITNWSTAGNATLSGSTLTANASSGWVDVRADKAGDANYNAASSASVRVYMVTRVTSFSFGNLSHIYDGSSKTATVSPSPAGATYTTDVTRGPTAGSYSISATANGNYSGTTSGTLTIAQASQTITFTNPGTKTFGTPLVLGATASSGLGVSYAIVSGPATVSGSTVTFTGIGTVTVRASQAGNANYSAAPNVDQAFSVTAQPTTFALSQTSFTYNGSAQGPTINPTPSGASFTPGGTTSATNAGSYTGTATATGNYTGSNASLTWSIAKANQSITFTNPGSKTYGTPLVLGATSTSGLAVTYSIVSGPATVSGNTVTFTGTGTVVVRASQAGDANYNAAPNVDQAFSVTAQPTTFALSQTSFTYNGSAQGPTINPTPSGATFTSGGTLSATNAGSYTGTATATGNYTGSNASLTWAIAKANQSITFTNPGSKTYGTPLVLGATSTSGLAVTYSIVSGPATVSGNTVTFTGTGTVVVRASQAGDANYNAATNVDQSFSVGSGSQTITFANPGTQTFGTPLNLGATASSGLAVSYAVTSGSATLSGSTLTFTGTGSVTITASQAGNANWSAATNVAQTFTVNAQPVTFALNQVSFAYTGTAQGPSVVPTPGGATHTTGGILSATAVGSYTGTATATGNYTGSNASLTWSITQGTQTITFGNPGAQTYGTPLTLGATASSGLSVTYSVSSGPATVSGNTVTFMGTGSVTVTAAQGGNASYAPATNVAQTFSVNQANQTISFANPGAQTYGTPLNLAATSSSGLAVSYVVTSGPATLSGNTVTFTGTGSVTITSSQAGNANYHAATNVAQTFTVNPANQTITFANPGTQTYGTPFTLSGTASSGLAVTFAVTSGPATLSGNTVTFTGTGSVTITASQAGNANYNAATNVPQNFMVNKATPTGIFANRTLGTQTESGYMVQAGELNATFSGPAGYATPSGTISYTLVGPGTTVTAGLLLTPGTYTVRASQVTDSNYLAATKDSTWTITADTDGDGVLNHIETILGTNPNAAKDTTTTGNPSEMNIHRPN